MSRPCKNGANCELHNGFYNCKCLAGYIGTHCEGTYVINCYSICNIPFANVLGCLVLLHPSS